MYRLMRMLMVAGVLILLVAGGVPGAASQATIDPSLVGYWKFDEGAGEVVKDSSGKGNNGAIASGVRWVEGKYDKALEFDGSSHVKFPQSEDLDITGNSITVEAWIKWREPTQVNKKNRWGVVIGKRRGSDGYLLAVQPSGKVLFAINGYSWPSDISCYVVSKDKITKNEWFHVAGTYDGKRLNIYVNGRGVRGKGYSKPIISCPEPLAIGNRYTGVRPRLSPFKGVIDEVKIYNRALGSAEIMEHVFGGEMVDRQKDADQRVKGAELNAPFEECDEVRFDRTPWEEKGISRTGGKSKSLTISGKTCVETTGILRFKIKDISKYQGKAIAVIVEYFDGSSTSMIRLFGYKRRKIEGIKPIILRKISINGTPSWKKHVFILPDAVIEDNSFSISGHWSNKSFIISRVWIKPIEKNKALSYTKYIQETADLYNEILVNQARYEDKGFLSERALSYLKEMDVVSAEKHAKSLKKFSSELQHIELERKEVLNLYDKLFYQGSLKLAEGKFEEVSPLFVHVKEKADLLRKKLRSSSEESEKLLAEITKLVNSNYPEFFKIKFKTRPARAFKKEGLITKKDITEHIFFGASWPYWPETHQNIEILNIDYVAVRPSRNSCLSPGKFNFDRLDKLIADTARKGTRSSIMMSQPRYAFPDWFYAKYGRGWDCYFKPEARKYLLDTVTALGEHFRNNPNVLCYELWNEPRAGGGYSEDGIKAFRRYLEERFKTIKELNRIWSTDYQNFASIKPPPKPEEKVKRIKTTPLIYYWERFRRDDFVSMTKSYIDALHKADPNHPVLPQFSYLRYKQDPKRGIDTFKLASAGWDIVSDHSGGYKRTSCEASSTYSANRYNKSKLLWQDEHYWVGPEGFGGAGEITLRASAQKNLWQQYTWGKKGFDFYTFSGDARPGCVADLAYDDLIIGYPGGVLPLMKEKGEKFSYIITNTNVISQIGVLCSTTSSMLAYPYETNSGELSKVGEKLFSNHYPFFFVPEEPVLDGRENLSEFDVVYLPYATHFLPDLTDKLLKYVENGGTLILSGPAGVYNELGRKDGELLNKLFGIEEIEYAPAKAKELKSVSAFTGIMGGSRDISVSSFSQWLWYITKCSKKAHVLAEFKDSSPAVMSAVYGKGRAYLSLIPVSKSPVLTNNFFFKILKEAVPIKLASCEQGRLELITRIDKRTGEHYLFVFNDDTSRGKETTITLLGAYSNIVDLDTNCAVPSKNIVGTTIFNLKLHPGGGTVLYLGKHNSPSVNKSASRISLLYRRILSAKAAGIDVTKYEKVFESAEKSFKRKRYSKALSIIGDNVTQLETLEINALFQKTSDFLEERDYNIPNRIQLNMAKRKWQRNKDYAKAKEYLENSLEIIFPIKKSPKKEKISKAVKLNKPFPLDGDRTKWQKLSGQFIPCTSTFSTRGRKVKESGDKDISAHFYTAWDDRNLYIGVDVTDDVLWNEAPEAVWTGDCVQIFLDILNDASKDNNSYGVDDYQLHIGINNVLVQGVRGSEIESFNYHITKRDDGYLLEVRIPLEEIDIDSSILFEGWTIGLNIWINDSDKQPKFTSTDPNLIVGGMVNIVWQGGHSSPFGWGKLRFVR